MIPLRTLDRKLIRDLWRMKGQVAAIGAVVAMGVMVKHIGKTSVSHLVKEGLARTFQNIKLFKNLSVLNNVLIAKNHLMKYGFLTIGKSTLSVLLLRLYDPQEGCIEIDGHDILPSASSRLKGISSVA